MNKKELKKKVFRLLERYGLFQNWKHHEWVRERRDQFFIDFMNLKTETRSKTPTVKITYEDITEKEL